VEEVSLFLDHSSLAVTSVYLRRLEGQEDTGLFDQDGGDRVVYGNRGSRTSLSPSTLIETREASRPSMISLTVTAPPPPESRFRSAENPSQKSQNEAAAPLRGHLVICVTFF